MVHLHNGRLHSRKKKKFLPFATAWTELETIILNEISWLVKNKHHVISLITGILRTELTNEQNGTRDVET